MTRLEELYIQYNLMDRITDEEFPEEVDNIFMKILRDITEEIKGIERGDIPNERW